MAPASLVIDRTHLGRRASGIERITEELFSNEALAPLAVSGMRSPGEGRFSVVASQLLRIPLAMARRRDTIWAFTGFPPSPLATLFRERCVMYVHDLFLITRRQDLNRGAKVYMAEPFRLAIGRLRYFMVNSLATRDALAPYLRPDAVVQLYRPVVRNVFGLQPRGSEGDGDAGPLVLGVIGTIEPRKNLLAAAAIAREVEALTGRPTQLHVIGRPGWGGDAAALGQLPHVKLLGFLPEAAARDAIAAFDMLICTSHDEGLGLPLIEAQYGGLQVVAPDQPVFHEVLGASGVFVDPGDVPAAARTIAARLQVPGWRRRAAEAAARNILRWNALAAADHAAVIAFLADKVAAQAKLSRQPPPVAGPRDGRLVPWRSGSPPVEPT